MNIFIAFITFFFVVVEMIVAKITEAEDDAEKKEKD